MEGMETTTDSVTSLLMSKENSRSKGGYHSIEEYCCNFLENSLFSPVSFALKMAEELKPVAFNVEPYQFELIATQNRTAKSQMIFTDSNGFESKRRNW